MNDQARTNAELIEEFPDLKQRIQELEQSESEHKRSEEPLREAERRLRAVYEHSSDVICTMDCDLIVTSVSNSVERNLGYRTDELVGRPYNHINMIAPESLEAALKDILRVLAGDTLTAVEYIFIRKDGSRAIAEVSSSSLVEDGKIIGSISVARDITERKRMEEEERRSKRAAERLAEEMAIIAEIGRLISSTLDIDEVYERFAEEAGKLIPFDRISVNLINPDGKSFSNAYVSGFDIPDRRPGNIVPVAGSISEILLQRPSGLIIHVESHEDLVRQHPNVTVSTVVQAGIRSMIGVPLISRDEVIGALHFRSKMRNAYTEQDLSLAERIGAQIAGAMANAQFFAEIKKTKDLLLDSGKKLRKTLDDLEITIKQRTLELEETNTTLRILIKKGGKDQKTLEENLQSNVNQLVTPFLSRLRLSQSNAEGLIYLNILEENLNHIVSPFVNRLSTAYRNLTPKEIQIAELIKQGKRSKEIAELFGVSVGTVLTHRNNMRKKLQLKSRDANLRSHLLSMV